MSKDEQCEKIAGNIQTAIFTSEDKGFQSIKFFFTYHVVSPEQMSQAFSRLKPLYDLCDKYIFGEEYGKTGKTPHIQGACILKYKMRASTISQFFLNGVTIRKLKNWAGALEYCRKEGNNIESSEPMPIPPDVMSVLKPWQQEVYDIYNGVPDHRTIHWWYGPKNMGKTEMVRFLWFKHDIPFSYGGSCADVMNLAFNNLKNCKAFVFCLTRIKKNHISYNALEQLKDGLISNNKYETGCFALPQRPHVFVFANDPPEDDEDEIMMSNDKIVVHSIKL